MSLDVYLQGPEETHRCTCPTCYNEHEATAREEFYSDNITHNLGTMAVKAGIYMHMWRPEEIGIKKARQLIEPLNDGLKKLKADPIFFRDFEPENKWGSYEGLVAFVVEYISACEQYPDADVHVSR